MVEDLRSALHSELHEEGGEEVPLFRTFTRPGEQRNEEDSAETIHLERVDRLPAKYDLITNSIVYKWETTAKWARKVSGPMKEWATEFKYRTGVHIEVEPTHPERIWNYNTGDAFYGMNSSSTANFPTSPSEAGDHYYKKSDDVELTVYLFGSERGVYNCKKLLEEAIREDPSYVRLALFRRVPGATGDDAIEWLALRRINREIRPPDVPPISLKTPGKYNFLHETHLEAAVRSCWEETGLQLSPANVFPTALFTQEDPLYYWRVPVYYYLAEIPYETEVKGPQTMREAYVVDFDPRLLKQSPDPIDRHWAAHADPQTGCAWLRRSTFNELQKPLKGEEYLELRYTPPPYSQLREVLGFREVEEEREILQRELEKKKTLEESQVKKGDTDEETPVSAETDPK
ncbi:NUDIX hydrolase [Angomonas deanei]|uniref:NUDIX domain containing protein n=1 Tax=Angomonas deanei TaxID=59799 RepID=A0A7G2C8H4_9TRYP|nr:NUDIX hydrolase [Angomonas deanei]CAD2216160.1 hypothetical protein, conserved [Angomonas deanei]|eukprot:EPY41936.1 NUDIX hydrolase [Angomonas deanei]